MGWLGKVGEAVDEWGLRDSRFERDAAAWKQWASDHGWTYREEAPDLVGRYEPEFIRGRERYSHLLTTQLHGFRVTAFEHRTSKHERFNYHGDDSISRHLKSFIVLQLPGLPPDEFVKMGPERAIRKLGGTVPSGHTLELVGDELVAHRPDKLDPISLGGHSELLALQLAAVPASFWRSEASGGRPTA